MSVAIKNSYIFVEPGRKAFKVASNFTNYIELGIKEITEYYLEAKIENDSFVINAILLDSHGKSACRVVNNFPDRSNCRKEMTRNGYLIFSPSGELILGIEVQGAVCFLKGTIYDSKGRIVATEKENDFLIFQGPAVIGKIGSSLGIVLS